MSDSYSQWKMTARFAAATQQAAATGDKVEWVHVIASDDTFTHEELDGLDDTVLKTIKEKQVTTISRVAITGSTVTITGVFTNTQNAADYQINTLLLVARYNDQEFLAGISIANSKDTAFRMPSESATEITEFTTRPQITLTTTGAISTSVDPVASATNERVDDVVNDLEEKIAEINKDKQSIWERLSNFVNKTESATISGVMTFASTIIGNISGNSGTTNKLKTPRKVNGIPFDGTKDIKINAPTERIKLQAGTNLNNIREEGLYHVVDNNRAMTIVNNPYSGDTPSFYLTVFEAEGYVRQETWHYFQINWRFARTFSKSEEKWREWEIVKN